MRGDLWPRHAGKMNFPPGSSMPAATAVVVQRLTELLLAFPAAAISGVAWKVLARRYEQRHGQLDIAGLGHSTPVAAATALLQGTGYVSDSSDPENPFVAANDSVVMTPHPDLLGNWPSLYQMLCTIVLRHGTPEKHHDSSNRGDGFSGRGPHKNHGLLLSQLKPLLQTHWHVGFDESGLGYLDDEGVYVRLKKMKHLVQTLVQWREHRVSWRAASGNPPTLVDEAVIPRLEVIPSRRHNDLLLRCICDDSRAQEAVLANVGPGQQRMGGPRELQHVRETRESEGVLSSSRSQAPLIGSDGSVEAQSEMEKELLKLRQENEQLRCKNEALEQHAGMTCRMPLEAFDDPFDPPPEINRSHCSLWVSLASPAGSTMAPSLLGSGTVTPMSQAFNSSRNFTSSGSATPASMAFTSSIDAGSGQMTPMGAQIGTQVIPVPVWFCGNFSLGHLGFGDRITIPNGIVQQARAIFERAPSIRSPLFPHQ